MPQILIHPEDLQGQKFYVRGPEAHHLIHVLRKKNRDEIDIFDGQGHRYRGRLNHIDPKEPSASGDIIQSLRYRPRRVRMRLFQGLPKGSKIDYIIEKATELGVDEIVPFLSQKSLLGKKAEVSRSKRERWNHLAKAASKQSLRSEIPKIEGVVPFQDLESWLKEGLTLVLHPGPDSGRIREAIKKANKSDTIINIVVGPESGLTQKEVESLKTQGVYAVGLGQLILRTETAGLIALAILNYELGEF